MGATLTREGINFSLFARNARAVNLVLFARGDDEPALELPLDPRRHKTGDVWHALIEDLSTTVEYGYRVDGGPVLIDPWARSIARQGPWGTPGDTFRCAIVSDGFDWHYDQPLNIPLADTIIYELHVRGFTAHSSSGVARPGTYAGLTEKIPYLKSLGVTAVELLPVHEFDECERDGRINLWGYQPLAFFAPNSAYASPSRHGNPVREFQSMVKSFHDAGIEVILDVVFNHTGEGGAGSPARCFRGIDERVYYMCDGHTGSYRDYTGCGNTLNCNHPVVRDMIRNCLRYWVIEMHVDGFRFDLAAVLGRGQDGQVLSNPPLLESLAHDAILSHTKLIAEAWDAAGLYQVGSFPASSRWAEWNGKFRDDIRRFVRGDDGMVSALASRLCGSPDLYQASEREPYHSINFVTCHDGFTLADLVSYERKHNEANGENNADGSDENFSANYGFEGPTADPDIQRLRARQMKNFIALLLMSHGVPMLLAGDEFGHTQRGNNNTYCQDNEVGWVDWTLERSDQELLEFVRALIRFRQEHTILRRQSFDGEDIEIRWNGVRLGQPDWSWHSRSLAMHVSGRGDHVYLIANAWTGDLTFELPALDGRRWVQMFDTSLPSIEQRPAGASYMACARSVVVLTAVPV
jgi:glycogen operon protein